VDSPVSEEPTNSRERSGKGRHVRCFLGATHGLKLRGYNLHKVRKQREYLL